nr:MAG TPA: hypothetical protein [Caudoviricetes sp.]
MRSSNKSLILHLPVEPAFPKIPYGYSKIFLHKLLFFKKCLYFCTKH